LQSKSRDRAVGSSSGS